VPEGDTIHRAAIRLRPALAGHQLTRFEAPRLVGDRPRLGDRIDDVEARGKHLLVHFGPGLTLRTHMKMTGSWHLYREGERWRKGAHLARAVVGADSGWVAVCFQAPVVETYHRDLGEPAPLASLGPDLTGPAPDLDLAVTRAAVLDPATEIADVLLDQRVASGIGNVYKSDVCWLHGIDPTTPVGTLGPDRLRAMFETAHRLLVANLRRTSRVTYRDGLAVYGRRGQPCPRCGTPVRMRRQGPMARSTYWCPECQVIPLGSADGL
jgi:endonuclease VIII